MSSGSSGRGKRGRGGTRGQRGAGRSGGDGEGIHHHQDQEDLNNSSDIDNEGPPRKIPRIFKSVVHREFQQEKVLRNGKETWTSRCKHCPDFVFGHKCCSELKRHLEQYHGPVYRQVVEDDKKQYEVKAEIESVPKTRRDNILVAYNKWILGEGLPLSVSESPLFKEFIRSIDDKVKIPGRTTTLNSITKDFEEMQERIKKKLMNCDMVHITCDMWSNSGLKSSFIGVTAHLFDKESKSRKNFIIALRQFNESHGAVQIIAKILELLDEYNIRKKVRFISTDGGRNIRRAILNIASMEEEDMSLFDEETEYDGDDVDFVPGIDIWLEELFQEVRKFKIEWLGCYCHRLQLVVLKGIKVRLKSYIESFQE